MSVAQLDAQMTSDELTRWAAYERVTGSLGQERDDQLTALLSERITSMLNRRKGRKVSVSDFLPQWDSGKSIRSTGESRQTPQQQKNILKALNARFGGKVS